MNRSSGQTGRACVSDIVKEQGPSGPAVIKCLQLHKGPEGTAQGAQRLPISNHGTDVPPWHQTVFANLRVEVTILAPIRRQADGRRKICGWSDISCGMALASVGKLFRLSPEHKGLSSSSRTPSEFLQCIYMGHAFLKLLRMVFFTRNCRAVNP